jgi:Domain of unknown function (DUF6438)
MTRCAVVYLPIGGLWLVAAALVGCSHGSTSPEPPAAAPIEAVTMHRSACHGSCPVYSVTVKADGTVLFSALEHVKPLGDSTHRVPAARVAELAKTIDEIGYWQWQDRYLAEEDGCAAVATDHPGVDIEVRRGGATKRVSYYYGCKGLPVADQIDRLSKTIDDVAGTAAFIGRE